MRAFGLNEFGGAEKLSLMDLPIPIPGPEDVLIRIRAAGVNPVDRKVREGLLQKRVPWVFPLVPGWDAAGVVEKTGKAVTDFKRGDEVYTYTREAVLHQGTYAEYISAPQSHVAHKPGNFNFPEAASVPLAALTAWQSLFEFAGLRAGQTVLIHAAAGGVGGFAVQLASHAGARVIGTASEENMDYVYGLGAAEVIDYRQADFAAYLERENIRPDIIMDNVGGEVTLKGCGLIRPGGWLVSILRPPDKEIVDVTHACGIRYKYVFVRPDGAQLKHLTTLIESEKLKTHIRMTFPFEQAPEALRLIETGHGKGKVVIAI